MFENLTLGKVLKFALGVWVIGLAVRLFIGLIKIVIDAIKN